jgi:hypothetical protein
MIRASQRKQITTLLKRAMIAIERPPVLLCARGRLIRMYGRQKATCLGRLLRDRPVFLRCSGSRIIANRRLHFADAVRPEGLADGTEQGTDGQQRYP